jgi:hypothetical protein
MTHDKLCMHGLNGVCICASLYMARREGVSKS